MPSHPQSYPPPQNFSKDADLNSLCTFRTSTIYQLSDKVEVEPNSASMQHPFTYAGHSGWWFAEQTLVEFYGPGSDVNKGTTAILTLIC